MKQEYITNTTSYPTSKKADEESFFCEPIYMRNGSFRLRDSAETVYKSKQPIYQSVPSKGFSSGDKIWIDSKARSVVEPFCKDLSNLLIDPIIFAWYPVCNGRHEYIQTKIEGFDSRGKTSFLDLTFHIVKETRLPFIDECQEFSDGATLSIDVFSFADALLLLDEIRNAFKFSDVPCSPEKLGVRGVVYFER